MGASDRFNTFYMCQFFMADIFGKAIGKGKALLRRTLSRFELHAETKVVKRRCKYFRNQVDSVLESADMQNMLDAIRLESRYLRRAPPLVQRGDFTVT